jgi:hypothetical protein
LSKGKILLSFGQKFSAFSLTTYEYLGIIAGEHSLFRSGPQINFFSLSERHVNLKVGFLCRSSYLSAEEYRFPSARYPCLPQSGPFPGIFSIYSFLFFFLERER